MTSRATLALAIAGCVLALSSPAVTAPQQIAAAPTPVVSSGDIDTAIALLDRIDRIVTNARKETDVTKLTPVGTSGTAGASAMVKVDVSDLDEIHAEVEQIKRLFKR